MRRFTVFIMLPVFFSCCVIADSPQVVIPATAVTEETSAFFKEGNLLFTAKTSYTSPLVLTFAGDLMAHSVNFNMKMYDLIYTDIQKILHNDDLSFINLETPVCDTLPLSTYPSFNVHTPYLRAAVQAGFDVLSLANNHTNDHGIIGIDGTLAAVRTVQKERFASEMSPRLLVFSGLKESENDRIQVTPLFYKGWSVLFCSVTEILNSYDSSKDRLYYSAPTKQGRAVLVSLIREARNRYPCDLFILGLHLNEPEYGRTVSEAKKAWFKQLGEAGVDIIWAHHPHVMQPWETITVERPLLLKEAVISEQCKVFCMYSMGNFISGQRWYTRYDNPSFYREYTGDAVMLQLTCTWNKAGRADFSVSPLLITQYNEPAYPVVKRFTQEWINTLNEKEKNYFKKRLALMEEYLPINTAAE